MFLNAYTRLLSRWAQHPDYGVNALLPMVPRHGGDGAVPSEVTVLDDVDSPAVQQDYEPPAKRALIVCVDADVPSNPDKGRGQGEQDRIVTAMYYMTKDMAVDVARKEGEYVLAAAATNQQILARRDFVESLGAPTKPHGTTDKYYRNYASVELIEIVDQVAVRLTGGAKASTYVGVLFTTWKGASIPLKIPGVF